MKRILLIVCICGICRQVLPATGEPIDPAMGKSDAGDEMVWYEGRVLGIEGQGWTDTDRGYDRLPARAQGVVPGPVWHLAGHSAGLLLRFATEATTVQVRWTLTHDNLAMPHMPATGVSGIDLYARTGPGAWLFVGNGRPTGSTSQATFRVTPGIEHVLYLPLYNGVASIEIGVPTGKTLSRVSPAGTPKPVVFYGTSITQGACASRPGMAATAIAGRVLDVPIINLGFSGNGRMEPALAELLCELDPALFVLDCLWNMSPEMVAERVAPFVRTLRDARPFTPIVLVEDSNVRGVHPTAKGRILREVFDQLTHDGIPHLHFLPNTGMLGADSEGTVDGTHPNDLGMMRQAQVFIEALRPLLHAAHPQQAFQAMGRHLH